MELNIEHLSKSFGDHQVLKDVSLKAESGKALGLLGRNGAGKTTTIRILLGLFHADQGTIRIDGEPISRKKITFGYLPEEKGLYPKRRIMDQLVYFARLNGMGKADAETACLSWLKKFHLDDRAQDNLNTLSKGNQQKCALITALVHEPDIMILDEPFSGLDPVNARVLENAVMDEIEKGKIVLFSGHQMNYIEEFCHQIAILNEGTIVCSGDLETIRDSYPKTSLFVRSKDISAILEMFNGRKINENSCILNLETESDRSLLMESLASRFDILEMRIMEPSLTDIFVDYTGSEENE